MSNGNCQLTYVNQGYGDSVDADTLGRAGFDVISSCWTMQETENNKAKAGRWQIDLGDNVGGFICMRRKGVRC